MRKRLRVSLDSADSVDSVDNDNVVLVKGVGRKGRIAFTIEFKISFFFKFSPVWEI